MLVELFSNIFKNKDETVRPKIEFNQGLNIILGGTSHDNSIGKSTMLLAIDFAFGGEDYAKEIEKLNAPQHTVFFKFHFDDDYCFSRSTENPNIILKCDKNYNPIENAELTNDNFKSFLKEKYKLNEIACTFRQIISPYFRIARKNQDGDSKKILSEYFGTGNNNPIDIFERLFADEYKLLQNEKENVKNITDAIKAFEAAKKFNYISSKITKKKDEERAKAEIKQLQEELLATENTTLETIFNTDKLASKRAAEIKDELKSLRIKRSRLDNFITNLENEVYKTSSVSEQDFLALQEFFPNADFEQLEKINSFHKKITGIMQTETSEEITEKKKELFEIDLQILELQRELESNGLSENITKAAYDNNYKIKSKIDSLNSDIKIYQKGLEVKNQKSEAMKILKAKEAEFLKSITTRINQKIEYYNNLVQNGKWQNPVFEFSSTNKSYDLKSTDSGSGSSFSRIILFDLAVSSILNIPAFAYDTYFFHEMEDERTEDFIKIFESSQKQIFIALDGTGRYKNINEIIARNTVIKLNTGNELFGKSLVKNK